MHVDFSSETILSVLRPLSSSVLVFGGGSCLVQVTDFEDVVELLTGLLVQLVQM